MSSDPLAQLDRVALAALCSGPSASAPVPADYAPGALNASAFGRALLGAAAALESDRSPASALHLAALSAQTRALAAGQSSAQARGGLAPLTRPARVVGTPLTGAELEETLLALNGDYEDSELVLARSLALGRLPDLRVLAPAVDALRKTRVAAAVAQELLPAYGPFAAERVRAGFDPRGRTSHVWRVTAATLIPCAASDAILGAALDEGSHDMQIAALAAADRFDWRRVEPVALECYRQSLADAHVPWFFTDSLGQGVRNALFRALARCPTDDALDALLASLSRVRVEQGWAAAAALQDCEHPSATERLLELLARTLRAARVGPDDTFPAAVLHALASPRHAGALDALRALAPARERDLLVWFAHRHALAVLGDEGARDELGAFATAGPKPQQLLHLRLQSPRPLLAYSRYALDAARLGTPKGAAAAEGLLDSYVPAKSDDARAWAEAYAPALRHPALFKRVRRAYDAHHARLLRALDPAELYERLAPLLADDAPERGAAAVLGWIAHWPVSSIDPRWADVAAARVTRGTAATRAPALAVLAQREDPRAVDPLRSLLDEDLRKRTRSAALADALAVYRPTAIADELRARIATAKPKSWSALYLDRLLDQMKQPRFERASAGSWATE